MNNSTDNKDFGKTMHSIPVKKVNHVSGEHSDLQSRTGAVVKQLRLCYRAALGG